MVWEFTSECIVSAAPSKNRWKVSLISSLLIWSKLSSVWNGMATIPSPWFSLSTWRLERQQMESRLRRSTRPIISMPMRSPRTNWRLWSSIWLFPLGKLKFCSLLEYWYYLSLLKVCFEELHGQGGNVECRRHWINGKPFRDPSIPNWHREWTGETNVYSNLSARIFQSL